VLYNGESVPEDCRRADVRAVAAPFTEIADKLGSSKVGNMAMLGALLELTAMLEPERVTGALRQLVKNPKFFELDLVALEKGREAVRSDENYLWGV
jgi:Pyruvate/2-oxoacid:ferredoxin oxidoreductase gamma subunit